MQRVVAQQVGKPIRSEPQPVAAAPALPTLRDVAYPGTLTLEVDATDLDRRIDDGSLDTGNLRLGFRNYPVYVLEH